MSSGGLLVEIVPVALGIDHGRRTGVAAPIRSGAENRDTSLPAKLVVGENHPEVTRPGERHTMTPRIVTPRRSPVIPLNRGAAGRRSRGGGVDVDRVPEAPTPPAIRSITAFSSGRRRR